MSDGLDSAIKKVDDLSQRFDEFFSTMDCGLDAMRTEQRKTHLSVMLCGLFLEFVILGSFVAGAKGWL